MAELKEERNLFIYESSKHYTCRKIQKMVIEKFGDDISIQRILEIRNETKARLEKNKQL